MEEAAGVLKGYKDSCGLVEGLSFLGDKRQQEMKKTLLVTHVTSIHVSIYHMGL